MQLEITIPNIVSAQYVHTKKYDSNNPSGKESKETSFVFDSNINSNMISLDYVGIGFRFIL